LLYLTRKLVSAEQANKLILAISEVLSTEELCSPYPRANEEDETDTEFNAKVSFNKNTGSRPLVAVMEDPKSDIIPLKKLDILLRNSCSRLSQLERIKNYFDNKDLTYTFTLYEKLILFNTDVNVCFHWLNEMLDKLEKNPQIILDKMFKAGHHDTTTIHLLIELTLDYKIALPSSLLKKVDYPDIPNSDIDLHIQPAKDIEKPANQQSYIKRLRKARSFAEATMIFKEVDQRFKRPNEDIFNHYRLHVQTFSDYEVFSDYFRKIYTLIPNDIFMLFKSRLSRLTFSDAFNFYKELESLGISSKLNYTHFNELLSKKGGTYTQRNQLFKIMRANNIRIDKFKVIKETFEVILDVSNAVDFYSQHSRYRRAQDKVLSLPIVNFQDIKSGIRFLEHVIKKVNNIFSKQADRKSYYPGDHCLAELIKRLDDQAEKYDSDKIWKFREDHMTELTLTRHQYHRLLEYNSNSTLALVICEDMVENGIRPNQRTNQLIQRIILGRSKM
jgi:hypothetical protein